MMHERTSVAWDARHGITRREACRTIAAGAASLALAACGAGGDAPAATTTATTAAVSDVAVAETAQAESGAQTAAVSPAADAVETLLGPMTIEQKVAQLFFVTPEQLTGYKTVTAAGEATRSALAGMPVGGLVYFSRNITGAAQLRQMLANTLAYSREVGAGVPAFLGVDEEGGPLVARVANSGLFDVERFPNMAEVGATGDPARAAHVGTTIGAYLREIGFTVDFAPDADVLTNPDNTAIGPRSFGSDPALVSDMVAAEVTAMRAAGCLPCVKHFPGHGDTAADSHTGEAISTRTLNELEACEYEPFRAGIQAGVPLVMVGHIKTPNAAGDDLPASLSSYMIGRTLRGELGFEGVIVSDSFSMGAVTQYFGPAEAAVRFLEAGGDVVLMPQSLTEAYQGVLAALASGTLDEGRIDESLRRVLRAKDAAGLLA